MSNLLNKMNIFWREEEGLSAVEYVAAGSLIVGGLVLAFSNLGNTIVNGIDNLTDKLK